VNEGVEDDKDPRGSGLGNQTQPHGKNGSSVVVTLQQARVFSLEQYDDGIHNFIVLGKVKEVGPVM
jgi:hypothetical protein